MKNNKEVLIITLIFLLISTYGVLATEYKIKVGDKLNVRVWGHNDLERSAIVRSDGFISFPLVGQIKVEGKTTQEAKQILENKLTEYIKNPEVIFSLIESRKIKVGLFGGVQVEGLREIEKAVTLKEAISMAGGLAPDANTNEIKVYTPEGSKTINYNRNSSDNNIILKDNYSVYIPRDLQKFTVIGEVKNPGNYKYEKGIHLLDAVATAGFLTDRANTEKIIIKRFTPQETRITINITKKNLENADLKEENNPLIKASDIIIVPEKGTPDIEHYLRMVPFVKDLVDMIY